MFIEKDLVRGASIPTNKSEFGLFLQLGWYEEAEEYILRRLRAASNDAEIHTQLVTLLFRQNRWRECHQKSGALLQDIPQDTLQWHFVNLARACAGIYATGALSSSLTAARLAMQSMEQELPPTQNNPHLMGLIVEFYIRIIIQVTMFSNWADVRDCGPSWVAQSERSWSSFLTWAKQLSESGDHHEAWLTTRLLMNRADEIQVRTTLEDIKRIAEETTPNLSANAAMIACMVSLAYVTLATSLEGAKQHLVTAQTALEALPEPLRHNSSMALDVAALELSVSDSETSMGKADKWHNLAEQALVSKNYSRADAYLTSACEIALRLGQFRTFMQWREQHESLLDKDTGNLRDLMTGRTRQWRFMPGKDLSRQLEWFLSMEKRLNTADNAVFDDPTARTVVETAKKAIYVRLHDEREEEACDARLKTIKSSMPRSYTTSDNIPYLREWGDLPFPRPQWAMAVLLRRLKAAITAGVLSQDAVLGLVPNLELSDDNVTPAELAVATNNLWTQEKRIWPVRLQRLREIFIAQASSSTDKDASDYLLLQLQIGRNQAIGRPDPTHMIPETLQEHERLLSLLKECSPGLQNDYKVTRLNSMRTMTMTQMFQASIPPNEAGLGMALELGKSALAFALADAELSQEILQIAILYYLLAEITCKQRRLFNKPDFSVIAEYLRLADLQYDILRRDLLALDQQQGIQKQVRFVDVMLNARTLNECGYRAYCFEMAHQKKSQASLQKLWEWIQRSKSRTWTDRLALTVRMPNSLRELASKNCEHAQLLDDWSMIRDSIRETKNQGTSGPNERYYARMHQDSILENMRSSSTLRAFANMVQGKSIVSEDIASVFSRSDRFRSGPARSVILVDWFTMTDYANVVKWFVLAARMNAEAEDEIIYKCWYINKDIVHVNNWIRKYLTDPAAAGGDDAVSRELQIPEALADVEDLLPFLGGLAGFIEQKDLVVLCPTGQLHRIPLHAITLPATENKPEGSLIETNDVVYTHSISMLRDAINTHDADSIPQARTEEPTTSPTHRQILGLFPIDVGDDNDDLRHDFQRFRFSRSLQDAEVTRDALLAELPMSSSVLFLGHVHDQPAEPLLSHICLFEDDPMHNPPNCAAAANVTLAAAGILDVATVKRGADIALIACASGTPAIMGADEPLGLVPSFLGSGAASTVSTLWPVRIKAGAAFTRMYLNEIDQYRPGEVVDLAACMRRAVLRLREEGPVEGLEDVGFADWAAFVYHGFWQRV